MASAGAEGAASHNDRGRYRHSAYRDHPSPLPLVVWGWDGLTDLRQGGIGTPASTQRCGSCRQRRHPLPTAFRHGRLPLGLDHF